MSRCLAMSLTESESAAISSFPPLSAALASKSPFAIRDVTCTSSSSGLVMLRTMRAPHARTAIINAASRIQEKIITFRTAELSPSFSPSMLRV